MGKRTRAAAAFAAASTSSLSNFLLKEVEGQDSDLNDIFSNSVSLCTTLSTFLGLYADYYNVDEYS